MASNRAASTLSWWRESGVDTLVSEEPRDWLSSRAAAPSAAAEEPAAPPLPDDLDAFREWLLSSDEVPLAAPGANRVAPIGDAASGLMVMVDMPADSDVAAGMLLSGDAGTLFDKMMNAIGRGRDSLYLASLSVARTPTGLVPADAAERLAVIARHHVGLVGPRALLLFGDACARALLGLPVLKARGRWHEIATPRRTVRALATIRPEKLLGQPALKKHAWEDLQLLMEGLTP